MYYDVILYFHVAQVCRFLHTVVVAFVMDDLCKNLDNFLKTNELLYLEKEAWYIEMFLIYRTLVIDNLMQL